MPYITITANNTNGEELDRRELSNRPLVIGRAPECDVAIHDILLSRRHCRLEPHRHGGRSGWKVIDLESKNGTFVNWTKVSEHGLRDGDAVRLGRTWMTFHAGPFVAAEPGAASRPGKLVRPADPFE